MLAGCRALLAIWDHARDLDPQGLADLGINEDWPVPSESTIRRALQSMDADDFDARVASWMFARAGTVDGRRGMAVGRARPYAVPEPKTTWRSRWQGPHLAAFDWGGRDR